MTDYSRITIERLREVLDYDPETGVFRWKIRKSRAETGTVAGFARRDGYRILKVDQIRLLAHRAAWAFMTGEWPLNFIDHINRDPSDNRFVNLREATSSENMCNRPKQRNNKSGYKGVLWHKATRKWAVFIGVNSKPRYIGVYENIHDAAAAYNKAAKIHHGEFAHNQLVGAPV